jgi:hypothetical protein
MILSKQLDDGYFVIPFTVQTGPCTRLAHQFGASDLAISTKKVQKLRYGAYSKGAKAL